MVLYVDFINTNYYIIMLALMLLVASFLLYVFFRSRRVLHSAHDLSPTILRWTKLLTHAWRLRFRMALWAFLGQRLQDYGAELSYRLRIIYLPPSGDKPKKSNRLKRIEEENKKK